MVGGEQRRQAAFELVAPRVREAVPQPLARALAHGAQVVIEGDVSEGSGENLFMITNGEIFTPPVADNNLTGITRDSAITLARDLLGIEVVERRIRRSELYLADEVFLTGTAAHITPVGSLDRRPIGEGGVGPMTTKIRDAYLEVIRGDNPKYIHWCTEVPLEG